MGNRIDFSARPDLAALGIDPDRQRAVEEIFHRHFAEGLHSAAQLVVVSDGQVVVDLAAGSFRSGQPVRPETPFYCFSVSKALTGMCVHKLIEQGRVSLDAPVADYWPQFARRGKHEVTIRQVFLHLAGIPAITRYEQIPLWPFWALTTRAVANLPLEYPPGTQMAYHALTWGFILGEVVRRVSGMPFEVFFAREFAGPLEMENSWFRIPSRDLRRSPRIQSGSRDQDTLVRVFNLRPIRQALMPAGSLNSTARDLAVFYQMLVNQGEYGGQHLLQPETVAQATTLGYRGWDTINQRDTLWAYGFHLGGRRADEGRNPDRSVFGDASTAATFGHMGNRSCMAWGDIGHRLVVAFTCNRLVDYQESRRRWIEINDAVWRIIG
jgi:CubicO group peptidase (beta-lactamase class C family)